MGSSPATQYQDAHFQPMAPVDLKTSAPIPDPAATPQAVRTKRNDPFQSNTATPLRTARPSRHQTSQPVDEPEQASPVQRTPKIKQSQSLGASQVASSSTRLEGPDVPGRSSAPPSVGHATRPPSTHSEGKSKGSVEDTVPRIRGNGSSTAKPAVRTSEDPYETDVTYDGLEGVRSEAETSYRQARPSDVAKGKRRAAPVSEATPASQVAPEIYPRVFPENYVKLYGALRLEKMFQRLDCQDAALKENTSFHLSVHGEHIFVKDPISLGSPAQLCLLTWGYPHHHDAIRDRIWGSGDERLPALDYHTFVFCCTQNSNKLRWYYIGKLRWAECETAPKWPRYHANAKKSLASKLAQSCEVGEDEAISNIENGEWQQLFIELTSNEELASTSERFLLSNFPGAKKGALKKNTSMTSI
ncbi:hypothetical protein BC629DRAFT_1514461 [Irpex lacteus]|nr:hypothetical protein BC629DRAFT_1514461 [Irpex lacteus]